MLSRYFPVEDRDELAGPCYGGGDMSASVDLHVHCKVSKAIPFQMEQFERMVERAHKLGLSGFALTEHFHSNDFWPSICGLIRQYPYAAGGIAVSPGFTVLTGAEVTLADRADVTLIGLLESLAWLDRQFSPRLSEGGFPYLKDLIEPAHEAKLLIIGAHPTRRAKRLIDLDEALLMRLDAIEVNGKDVASGPADETIEAGARRLGLPVVGGSDAHYWPQVGIEYTVIPCGELTLDELRRCLAGKCTSAKTGRNVRRIVHTCSAYKRRCKARRIERGMLDSGKICRPASLISVGTEKQLLSESFDHHSDRPAMAPIRITSQEEPGYAV